ncbi:MAG: hypothetical protein QM714_00230 [Nocardioides sp.]|uniref:hypothetical protein n=1 Tax=Nocardioides sp. TaxID=35761 RepID=UPI0039E5D4D4
MARTRSLLLMTGDYAERLTALYVAAQNAANDDTPTRIGESPYADLREEYDALKAEAEENGIRVVMEAVNRKVWRDLKAKHPARTEHPDPEVLKGDRMAGVNTETVEDDLVYASLRTPEFASRAAYDEWADGLSEGDFQTVLAAAWELANGSRFDPKSLPASPTRSVSSS